MVGIDCQIHFHRPTLPAVSCPQRESLGKDSHNRTRMGSKIKRGYASAISGGVFAALAAISAKLFSSQLIKYGFVVLFNVTMWGCYTNSLRALSSLQATVASFAANFLSSGLAGFFLFEEKLSFKET
ncbi:hypothetical protein AKJ16_DCAP09331 [Drosera capensis]